MDLIFHIRNNCPEFKEVLSNLVWDTEHLCFVPSGKLKIQPELTKCYTYLTSLSNFYQYLLLINDYKKTNFEKLEIIFNILKKNDELYQTSEYLYSLRELDLSGITIESFHQMLVIAEDNDEDENEDEDDDDDEDENGEENNEDDNGEEYDEEYDEENDEENNEENDEDGENGDNDDEDDEDIGWSYLCGLKKLNLSYTDISNIDKIIYISNLNLLESLNLKKKKRYLKN